jgi:hypothetical protein
MRWWAGTTDAKLTEKIQCSLLIASSVWSMFDSIKLSLIITKTSLDGRVKYWLGWYCSERHFKDKVLLKE